jgi:hypothetical protein
LADRGNVGDAGAYDTFPITLSKFDILAGGEVDDVPGLY